MHQIRQCNAYVTKTELSNREDGEFGPGLPILAVLLLFLRVGQKSIADSLLQDALSINSGRGSCSWTWCLNNRYVRVLHLEPGIRNGKSWPHTSLKRQQLWSYVPWRNLTMFKCLQWCERGFSPCLAISVLGRCLLCWVQIDAHPAGQEVNSADAMGYSRAALLEGRPVDPLPWAWNASPGNQSSRLGP